MTRKQAPILYQLFCWLAKKMGALFCNVCFIEGSLWSDSSETTFLLLHTAERPSFLLLLARKKAETHRLCVLLLGCSRLDALCLCCTRGLTLAQMLLEGDGTFLPLSCDEHETAFASLRVAGDFVLQAREYCLSLSALLQHPNEAPLLKAADTVLLSHRMPGTTAATRILNGRAAPRVDLPSLEGLWGLKGTVEKFQ